jgi:hypothetical protein
MLRPTTKRRWHFSLGQACIGIALANVLFALIAWGGLLGGVLFAEAFGSVLIAIGIFKGNPRYLAFGLPLAIIAGGLLLVGSAPVARGCGSSKQPYTIEVVDQTRSGAVVGAIVRIRDVTRYNDSEWVPIQPIPVGERVVGGTTDGNGSATIISDFPYSERTGLFVNEAYIYVSDNIWLQVDAPGYKQELVQLNSFTGRSYDYFRLPLPKVKVQLKRS